MTNRDGGRLWEPEAQPFDLAAPAPMVPVRAGRRPGRRPLAAAALTAVLAIVVALTTGWDLAGAPLWCALTLATILTAASALATYVPTQGWHPDLGCGSCAAAAGLAALGGTWLATTSAFDGGTASLGLALAGAALAKRLTDPAGCTPR